MKKLFILFLLMISIIVGLTACTEKGGEESDEIRAEIKEAKNKGDTAKVEELEEQLKNLGYWYWYRTDVLKTTPAVDKSDELQKVVYTFNAQDHEHTLTLDYEPLESDSDIPAYQQKCVCTLGEMPTQLDKGQSYRVDVKCEYIDSNEYAGISNGCWLVSTDENIKIVNNDGYTREDLYVGERKKGRHDSLSTSFTITLPEFQGNAINFDIRFESDCGVTAYNYVWAD